MPTTHHLYDRAGTALQQVRFQRFSTVTEAPLYKGPKGERKYKFIPMSKVRGPRSEPGESNRHREEIENITRGRTSHAECRSLRGPLRFRGVAGEGILFAADQVGGSTRPLRWPYRCFPGRPRQQSVMESASSLNSLRQVSGSMSGAQLRELAAQQDEPQQVAEDNPLLSDDPFGGDQLIEVAPVTPDFAGDPDGPGH